jgi:Ca2+/Na+ antiporter
MGKILVCPACGSTEFVIGDDGKKRCAYCATEVEMNKHERKQFTLSSKRNEKIEIQGNVLNLMKEWQRTRNIMIICLVACVFLVTVPKIETIATVGVLIFSILLAVKYRDYKNQRKVIDEEYRNHLHEQEIRKAEAKRKETSQSIENVTIIPQVVVTSSVQDRRVGHSLFLHILLGFFILWINVLYISLSPHHYWR